MESLLKHKLPVILRPIFKSQRTQKKENVSPPMQEPYILTGYRLIGQPWNFYLLSLFNWHNETINVWTHLVAFVCILIHTSRMGETYDLFNSTKGACILGYSLGACAVTLLSFVAHLFHSKSLKYHYLFFMIDYMGVSMYSFGCGILTLYCFCPEKTFAIIGSYYLPIHLVLCYNTYLSCSVAKVYFLYLRRNCLVVSACIASVISMLVPTCATYYYCLLDKSCQIWSLNHLALMYVGLFSTTVAYLAHQPEKSNPGTFDIVGHSHQWLHVLIFCTIVFQYRSMEIELKMRETVGEDVTYSYIFTLYGLLVAIEILTMIFFLRNVNQKANEIHASENHKHH